MKRNTTVAGVQFEVEGCIINRGTFATNMETNEKKQISYSGYITNDLTVRKAIANRFGLATFRK